VNAASTTLVVGGGLAGMATALALADVGVPVTLVEAKRNLGGRASSFRDAETDRAIDFCQHVGLGCCTNLADFCQRVGIAHQFDRIRTLHFIGPNREHCRVTGSRWLPAPLHMLPVLWGLKYLSLGERFAIARSLRKLSRRAENDPALDKLSMQAWLETERQTENAISGFWKVILVSALSERLENISVASARKVFVEGFMATRHAYEMLVPRLPLGELYGDRLRAALEAKGVRVHSGSGVRSIEGNCNGATAVKFQDGRVQEFSAIVLATPWRTTVALVCESLRALLPQLNVAEQFLSAPITGVHLWFDRPITDLPHAVLVNRLSHWIFKPGFTDNAHENLHYYQIVISASHELASLSKDQIVARILGELDELFPNSAARLIRSLVVTEKHAIFSPLPGMWAQRPAQQTAIPNLFLAGDWTATDWPSTMEGAVRSGYLAAERLCEWLGKPQQIVVPNLRRGLLAKLLIR
jgi:squalene-associated FAD-dependent desaturase